MFYVRTNDGVKIAVYDLNPTAAETVFLVHGWPLSHRIFEYQETPLICKGYRVVEIDLRGFGSSDKPACGYTYDRMADDIYAVVRALNLQNFTLAGYSMGGAIVLRYMARHRGYGVKKLALLSAAAPRLTQAPGFCHGVPASAVDQWAAGASTDRPALIRQFGGMLFALPHSQAITDWLGDVSRSASGIATIQTACALRDEDGRADLARVCVPTGVFHGRQDRVVPFDLALVTQQGIRNAVLYPFDQSGHGIFYDELDRFNSCFLQFLAC